MRPNHNKPPYSEVQSPWFMILNVYEDMSTHTKRQYCTLPEVLSYLPSRASCYKEPHQVFSSRRVCCCLFHCTVFTGKAWDQILTLQRCNSSHQLAWCLSSSCDWDFDPHAVVFSTLRNRNLSIAVIQANCHVIKERLFLLINGQN